MKREATADAIGTHERASATPAHVDESAAARHGAAPAWLPAKLDLRAQQRWFADIVTTPENEPAPVDERSAAALVTPSATLTALERLEIYRRSYHARLVECLADDYPVLQHHLGPERFDALCRSYIARFPSTEPNLNVYGRHMAELCRDQPLPAPGFAADLASLEWAIVLVIHAPTSNVISEADLARVPADRWAEARLVGNPSLRILHFDYPVNAYLQAFRLGESPDVPSARKTSVAVYRTGATIWRTGLTEAMVALFESLAAGETLSTALDRVAPLLDGTSEAQAAQQVMGWFKSGVASGLFANVGV